MSLPWGGVGRARCSGTRCRSLAERCNSSRFSSRSPMLTRAAGLASRPHNLGPLQHVHLHARKRAVWGAAPTVPIQHRSDAAAAGANGELAGHGAGSSTATHELPSEVQSVGHSANGHVQTPHHHTQGVQVVNLTQVVGNETLRTLAGARLPGQGLGLQLDGPGGGPSIAHIRTRSPSPGLEQGSLSSTSSTESMDEEPTRTAAVPELDDTPAHPQRPEATKGQVNLRAALMCLGLGLAVRFLVPIPQGITAQAWTLLAVFTSTIAGLVLEPMPVSAWSLVCVTSLLATKACSFQTAFSGLTNEAIWLIVFAFFFAKAFEKTGLGERVANMFVAAVGHSTLGVAYSLAVCEALVSPAMPSCTARAGGVFMPVIKFLAKSSGSEPTKGRRKMGAFLVHSQMQVSPTIAALFMTGAAQNLLAINIARNMGVVIPDIWATWTLGALLPGLVCVAITPLLTYQLAPPEVKSTPSAPAEARQRLEAMGPLSRVEILTLLTLSGAVVVWSLGEALGVSAVLGAMLALCSLLATGVLSWKDCLDYTPAWDTLVWFSVLMGMCSAMSDCGLVGKLAGTVHSMLSAAKLNWLACFGLLHAIFFWSHYIFASQVGHVGALYGAFLAMMIASGAPPLMAALTLAYSSCLYGSLTHYASGPAAVFYGSGYMRLSEVMHIGFVSGLRTWVTWAVVGMAWWKLLGWW